MDDSIQNKLAVLEGLIKLLPLSGHAVAAARLTSQLASAQLGLLSASQLGVLTAEALQLLGSGERAAMQAQSAAAPLDFLLGTPLQGYAAFLQTIDPGGKLIASLNQLALAETTRKAAAALTTLFVEHLGYGADGTDETRRLRSTGTLHRLISIARHREFVIILAEATFTAPYPNIAAPVFQLHPYSLVVLFSPGHSTCRFIYRQHEQRWVAKARLRTLVGRRRGPGDDNLVVWAYRMSRMRPGYSDDGESLVRKTSAALASPADVLTRDWMSAPLDLTQPIPGPGWEQLAEEEWRAFAQLTPNGPRWLWGIERVLRDLFPMPVAGGAATLFYLGYEATGAQVSFSQAVQEGSTMGQAVLLRLCMQSREGEQIHFNVEAMLPGMCPDGKLLLAGRCYRFIPQVLPSGQQAIRAARRRVELEDAGFYFPELEIAQLKQKRQAGLDKPEEQNEDAWAVHEATASDSLAPAVSGSESEALPGASLCQLLEAAAQRKLGRLAQRLWRIVPSEPGMAGLLTCIDLEVTNLRGRDTWLLIVSRGQLQSYLSPIDEDSWLPSQRLPVLRQQDPFRPALPPAWACLDASAGLPFGYWLPVAGARLSPGGHLTVPLTQEDGSVRLAVPSKGALELNPRAGGSEPGPASHWIASGLSPLAALSAGTIESATARLRRSLRFPEVWVYCRPGPSLCCRVSAALLADLPREQRRLTVQMSCPYWADLDERPSLRVQPGQSVAAGDIWLQAPRSLWRKSRTGGWLRQRSQLRRLVDAVYEVPPCTVAASERYELFRIPSSLTGTIVSCSILESPDRSGETIGYRATVTVQIDAIENAAAGFIALDDGRLAPIVGELQPEDAPFSVDGEPAQVVIEIPALPDGEPQDDWFDGRNGELHDSGFAVRKRLEVLPRSAPFLRRPERWQLFRARDREGLPGHPSSPALSTRQRLFWAARDPDGARHLNARESTWLGGEPGYMPLLRELLVAARLDGIAGNPAAAAQAVLPLDGPAEQATATGTASDALIPPSAHQHFVPLSTIALGQIPVEVHSQHKMPRPGHAPLLGPFRKRGRPCESPPPMPQLQPQFQGETRSAVHTPPLLGRQRPVALHWAWRCVGGHISGPRAAWQQCPHCDSYVRPRTSPPRPDLWSWLHLPEPVLHPWHLDSVAALLGLTADELLTQQAQLGLHELIPRIQEALVAPHRLAAVRLKRTRDHETRAGLMWSLHLLNLELGAGTSDLVQRAQLDSLPVPPSLSEQWGLPHRAPAAVNAPLARAYQHVYYAARRLRELRRSALPILVEEGRRGLQDSVMQLFGSADQRQHAEEPHSLAELVTRLWPLTRAAGLRSTPLGALGFAGLVDPAALQQPPANPSAPTVSQLRQEELLAQCLNAEPPLSVPALTQALQSAPTDTTSLAMVDGERLLFAPHLPVPHDRPGTYGYWRMRTAYARLHLDLLGVMLATLGSMIVAPAAEGTNPLRGGQEVDEAWLQAQGISLPAEPTYPIGRFMLRELLAAVEAPTSELPELLDMITLALPRTLPADSEAALNLLNRTVAAAFPGTQRMLVAARTCLAHLFCGFYQVEVTPQTPLGWIWQPPQDPVVAPARRALPPLHANAWFLQPLLLAVRTPVRFLASRRTALAESGLGDGILLGLGLLCRDVAAPDVPREAEPAASSWIPPTLQRAPALTADVKGADPIERPPRAEVTSPPVAEGTPDVADDEVQPLQSSLLGWLCGGIAGAPVPALALVVRDEVEVMEPSLSEWLGKPPIPEGAPHVAGDEVQLLQCSLRGWLCGATAVDTAPSSSPVVRGEVEMMELSLSEWLGNTDDDRHS